jgi:hypothetical protein
VCCHTAGCKKYIVSKKAYVSGWEHWHWLSFARIVTTRIVTVLMWSTLLFTLWYDLMYWNDFFFSLGSSWCVGTHLLRSVATWCVGTHLFRSVTQPSHGCMKRTLHDCDCGIEQDSYPQKLDIPCTWIFNVTGYVWPFVYGYIDPDEICHVRCLIFHSRLERPNVIYSIIWMKSPGHFYRDRHRERERERERDRLVKTGIFL